MNTINSKSKLIKILIVDDHKMVRDGIKIMLESQEERMMFSITEAESGELALELVNENDFDIILMDQQLTGILGAEVVVNIMKLKPESKVLAVSNYDEFAYISDMLKSGAKGYVLKNIGPDELFKAIETILDGKNYYANDVAIKLINVNSIQQIESNDKASFLSNREMEILKMIAEEYTNDQIAKKLNVAKRTVDSHRQNLLHKLNVKNTVGLINYVHKHKLV